MPQNRPKNTSTPAHRRDPSQSEKANRPEQVTQPDSLDADLLYGPAGLFGQGRLEHRAAQLSDPRLAEGERHALAEEIGLVQGNLHLQRVIESLETRQNHTKHLPSKSKNRAESQNIIHVRKSPKLQSIKSNIIMRHPAERILLRAGRWLLKRTTNTVTRHIANHTRRIAGKALHTIFRNPRRIHHLISRTVREAMGIARTATAHSAQLLEQGGIQILRQVTRTPGKFRVVVLKQFDRAIGVNGETVLKIVIDMSGRVVTAYPVERLLALGVTAVSVNIFDENTARASERIRSRAREEFAEEEERPIDWIGELIDLLNPLSIDYLNQAHCAAWE